MGDEEKKSQTKFEDGDEYPQITKVSEIVKDDRWCPPKDILGEMGAEDKDLVAWRKCMRDGKKGYCLTVLNPDLYRHLDIKGKHEKEIYRMLMQNIPKGKSVESDHIVQIDLSDCDYIVQVKSQGRFGSKKYLKEIFRDIGLSDKDWLSFDYLDNDMDGCGWFLFGIKDSDIHPSKKRFVEE